MTIRFVIPDPIRFSSGGNLYNQALMEVMQRRGHHAILAPKTPNDDTPTPWIFWDTLLLEHLLTASTSIPDQRHILIAHADTTALQQAIPHLRNRGLFFLATGPFMVDLLVSKGILPSHIFLLEPPSILRLPVKIKQTRKPHHSLDLLMVASLTRDKGLLDFFKLWGSLGPPAPMNIRIDVFGDDRIDEQYARQIKAIWNQTSWQDIVSYQGLLPRHQFLENYQQYDALLSVSPSESYGMAIAEALAAGLPVLARTGGNVSNLVIHQENGLLFQNNLDLITWLMQPVKKMVQQLPQGPHPQQNMPGFDVIQELEHWLSSAG